MAQFILLSIRDRVADVYQPPYAVTHVGVGVRMFTDEINRADAQNMLYRHPQDFDLFQVGTYDDATGMVTQDSQPRQLVLGRDCKSAGVDGNGV